MTKEEVEAVVQDWKKEWCVPISEDQLDLDEDMGQENPSSQNDGEEGETHHQRCKIPTPLESSSTTPTNPVVGEKRKQTETT